MIFKDLSLLLTDIQKLAALHPYVSFCVTVIGGIWLFNKVAAHMGYKGIQFDFFGEKK